MKTKELRQAFLDYFQKKDHTLVPGSSLVPHNDPSLLFTNAGMVQFKDTFLGLETRPYTRAVSCQPCVRAGGKHNDLENVGYTARHHTFFEMLGNFSFGEYFKREAIQFAWDFLTNVLKLPKERLWVTVFEQDKETEEIWLKEMGIDPKRFSRCGEKDNFWSMGDTGPCGPCTEIFYDHGPEIPGGPPGSKDEDGDRYIEIWNLVFMQYNRGADKTLTPLSKPSVDTGMGMERIAAVMQGVHSNYEIDIFKHLISSIIELGKIADVENKSLRVIADHIRSTAFLIVDGVFPSNEGRGYVLRRICRRAIRHGQKLGFKEPFFYKLVKPLAEEMGEAYPELVKRRKAVEEVLLKEEQQFAKTLEQGLKILEEDLAGVQGSIIPGATVFRLYDTYGFPVDLTADIARERNMSIDMDGFNEAMAAQRTRARESSQFAGAQTERLEITETTEFTGYELLEQESKIIALFNKEGQAVKSLNSGEIGSVVLDATPFYAEGGGQVGDQGILKAIRGKKDRSGNIVDSSPSDSAEFLVQNTTKAGKAHVHQGELKSGVLSIGDTVTASVDKVKRRATALNHSATHLLHAALRKILGPSLQQKGSLVEPERLRFDFSYGSALTPEQISAVEHLVNEHIRLNTEVKTDISSVEEAMKSGALALFGEKYGEKVRVLRMRGEDKDFSVELCGGTHVRRTGDIGLFKITQETGIAAGVRRIEAVTGLKAQNLVEKLVGTLDRIAATLKIGREGAEEKIEQILNRSKQLEKEISQLKLQLASGKGGEDLSQKARKMQFGNQEIYVLSEILPMGDPKILRETVDRMKDKLKSAVIVLAVIEDGKVSMVAGVTDDLTAQISASELIQKFAKELGGKGGGRADFAQAGGNVNDLEALKNILNHVQKYLGDKAQVV